MSVRPAFAAGAGLDAQSAAVGQTGLASAGLRHGLPVPEDLAGGAELLAAADEPIESVCADGVYDTRDCLDVIAQRQAMAVIPLRKNASHWKRSESGFGTPQRGHTGVQAPGMRSGTATTGAALWRRRCTASSDWARGGTVERQLVELHVRAALLNRFSQIGSPQTVPVAAGAEGRLRLGLGRPRNDLCNRALPRDPQTGATSTFLCDELTHQFVEQGADFDGRRIFDLPSFQVDEPCVAFLVDDDQAGPAENLLVLDECGRHIAEQPGTFEVRVDTAPVFAHDRQARTLIVARRQ